MYTVNIQETTSLNFVPDEPFNFMKKKNPWIKMSGVNAIQKPVHVCHLFSGKTNAKMFHDGCTRHRSRWTCCLSNLQQACQPTLSRGAYAETRGAIPLLL